jgi:hypothetical protein
MLSKAEAASHMGCTRATFDAWVTKYNIPYTKKWGLHLFNKKDLPLIKKYTR